MKHARSDYDRIQDPAGLIPVDEPVFLIRAQDEFFVEVVSFYRDLVWNARGDQKIIEALGPHIDLAEAWPVKKSPDMP